MATIPTRSQRTSKRNQKPNVTPLTKKMNPIDFIFKVVVVGDSGVGKTCLLSRFADGAFVENHPSTIGIDFKIKVLHVIGSSVKLQIVKA